MLSVAQALEIVLQNARPLRPMRAALAAETLGLVLAQDVISDLDMPPFDKAMMDGFALRSSDLLEGRGELTIVEEILAGKTPTVEIATGQASRIMTGAPIPQGADAVVMIERCEIIGDKVRIDEPRIRPRLNIFDRAQEMRVGETVIRRGTPLTPQAFGLLAAVGRNTVGVVPAPRVAILATGDELVPVEVTPGPGQIRNSNGPMLLAQVVRAGGVPKFVGIAKDEPDDLCDKIAEGLQADVLVLSGGVSAGKLDLVPGMLAELGVEALFHKVSMKPGKPVLFGVRRPPQPLSPAEERGANPPPRLIFGLPGNPVSSLICFELFVRPAICALMAQPPGPPYLEARLVKDFPYHTDRPTYHPARLRKTESGWQVMPTEWLGSSDLRGLLGVDSYVVLPAGEHVHRAGEPFSVLVTEPEVYF